MQNEGVSEQNAEEHFWTSGRKRKRWMEFKECRIQNV
jgi:hypothetical protein